MNDLNYGVLDAKVKIEYIQWRIQEWINYITTEDIEPEKMKKDFIFILNDIFTEAGIIEFKTTKTATHILSEVRSKGRCR